MPAAFQDAPGLLLGFVGFDSPSVAQLHQVARRQAGVRWLASEDLRGADAWLIASDRVQPAEQGHLLVPGGPAARRPAKLSLEGRPVAFTRPAPMPGHDFDPGSDPSVEAVLRGFEIRLQGIRTWFEIGRAVVRGGPSRRHSVYHIKDRGRLAAVLNFPKGTTALAPDLHPAGLRAAVWERRPDAAGAAPPGFVEVPTAQMAWVYAQRSETSLLPQPYRTRLIHLRRMPRVPLSWLSEFQLEAIDSLSHGPCTLHELAGSTLLPLQDVERALACLYFGGAITTSPDKSGAGGDRGARPDFAPTTSGFGSDALGREGAVGGPGRAARTWLSMATGRAGRE